MNLSGILVLARPENTEAVARGLSELPGVEVHYRAPSQGKLVIVQEAESVGAEVESIMRIKAHPGVISAEMVEHWFEDDNETPVRMPDDLDAMQGIARSLSELESCSDSPACG
jgi:nitrate reductase NapAB chaperone NapD